MNRVIESMLLMLSKGGHSLCKTWRSRRVSVVKSNIGKKSNCGDDFVSDSVQNTRTSIEVVVPLSYLV